MRNRRPVYFASPAAALVVIVAMSACGPGDRNSETQLVVLSYNIRVNVASDGEYAWPNRADRVAALIRFHEADVAGLQEATRSQVQDLVDRLPEYDWYGVGRDDGADAGEFVPIFYRRDRLAVQTKGSFWLSETPNEPGSVGWDAALPRVTSWLVSKMHDGDSLVIFNTHFDHVGEDARVESARLLREQVVHLKGKSPAIVMGDFNARPGSEPYRVMTVAEEGLVTLRDARTLAPEPYGPDLTFGTFAVGAEEDGRIDFVFVTSEIAVIRHGVLTDQLRGAYPSDHLPVLAEIEVRK